MATGASGSGVTDLESMMEELGLNEGNLQDVMVEDDDLPEEAVRWMAIVRVHTDKAGQYWFYWNMRAAWDLAQEV